MTYTRTAVVLHWTIALLIFIAFPLGLYMHELPLSPTRLQLYSYHKWLGITVLLLSLARLAWRATHAAPPYPAGMAPWQRRAASAVHGLLYLLILAVPLSGWLMSSAKGVQTVWLGVLPLPDLVGKDKALGEALEELHEILNYGLLTLVLFHVAAAAKHQFVDRDGLLARMRFRGS